MRKITFCVLPVLLFLCTVTVNAQQAKPEVSTTLVISQVYGGAGCGTAGCSSYQNDFIEIFNRGGSPVNVNGWSVQYSSATGTSWQVTNLPNVTLTPGQHLLVAEVAGPNGVSPLPTPDVTGTIAMSATAGKIALVNSTTALSGSCPTGAQIIDLVGYGATANCFETAVAPAPSTTNADMRGGNGYLETDNNSTDFTAATPLPRNTSSPIVYPVTLSSFSGEKQGTVNRLFWTTATETNNSGFEVQRSTDGISFSKLAFVASKADNGNSTALLSYRFDDTKALPGNNYYRLRQLDKDGKYAYTATVLIKGEKIVNLTLGNIYPNPVQKELHVIITSPAIDKVTISITDMRGKILMVTQKDLNVGDNRVQLALQQLAPGNYVLKVTNGNAVSRQQFVKE